MLYICPWQAPELPPLRLISSMITEASASPRPEPPYSSEISAASQPAGLGQSIDEGFGIGACLIDLKEIVVREIREQRTDGVAEVLMVVNRRSHVGDPCDGQCGEAGVQPATGAKKVSASLFF